VAVVAGYFYSTPAKVEGETGLGRRRETAASDAVTVNGKLPSSLFFLLYMPLRLRPAGHCASGVLVLVGRPARSL
jgi:hypothetical protein